MTKAELDFKQGGLIVLDSDLTGVWQAEGVGVDVREDLK